LLVALALTIFAAALVYGLHQYQDDIGAMAKVVSVPPQESEQLKRLFGNSRLSPAGAADYRRRAA